MAVDGAAVCRTASPAAADRPLVIALGEVAPELVVDMLGEGIDFEPHPGPGDITRAAGAIVRADARVDRALLERMPDLKVLARSGVGVDRVDVNAATERGIPVVITPGSGSRAVAEGVLAHALHLTKRLTANTALVREGRWSDRTDAAVVPGDLDGATIGIIGFGRIGRRVADLASAFGMRVLAFDPLNPPTTNAQRCEDITELVTQSDIVTLHVPLTPDTHHLADAELIAQMRPGSVLINCGRGGLLDLDAAHAAVQSGHLAGLGLDTFDPEPAVHHPVFDEPNVSLTPHMLGLSRRGTALTFADAAQGVVDVLAGRAPAATAHTAFEAREETTP